MAQSDDGTRMRSVPPRGSGWVTLPKSAVVYACIPMSPVANGLRLLIKIRQVISLAVHHIVNRSRDALLIPQPFLATFIRPRTKGVPPKAALSQSSRRVCFERP